MLAARSSVAPEFTLRRSASWAAVVAVGLGAFVLLLLAMPRELNTFDEGIILSGAMRVLAGEVLHRDFYSLYGPAQYYAVAAALDLTPHQFLAARLWDVAIRAATIAAIFAVLRPVVPLVLALAFAALGGVCLLLVATYLYPVFPCILLAVIATAQVTRFATGRAGRGSMLGAGLCAGAAALFRYDAGFMLAAANMLALLVLGWVAGARPRRVLAGVLAYAGGCALVFVPPAIAYLLVAPVGAWVDDIITYAMHHYASGRGMPFPRPGDLLVDPADAIVYVPLLAAALAGVELFRRARRRAAGLDPAAAYLIAFGIAAFVLFFKGVVRVSPIHMMLAIVPALIVIGLAAASWRRHGAAVRALLVVAIAAVLIPAASTGRDYLIRNRRVADRSVAGWLVTKAGLMTPSAMLPPGCEPTPALRFATVFIDYALVSNYIDAHSRPDERILVAPGRHDKIFVNPMALYFTTGRLPATHWSEYDPGIQNRADVQQTMIAELQRYDVRWIVRDTYFDTHIEPNLSAVSTGVKLMDTYIDEHYRPVARSGQVTVWLRKDVAAPPPATNGCEAPALP
jgi:hypothetical protein